MAALWVKEQARGQAALVVVGRPKRWLDRFDLVIAPPQFQLPPTRQCVASGYALDAGRRGRDRRRERGMARALRRPAAAAHRAARGRADQTVPLRPGGRPAADGERPARRAAREAAQYTSPPVAARRKRWWRRSRPEPASARRHAGTRAAPTPTTLCSLADWFIVTGGSISMMVEVSGWANRCHLPASSRSVAAALARHARPAAGRAGGWRAGWARATVGRAASSAHREVCARSVEIHRRLYARGLAPLGQPFGAVDAAVGRLGARSSARAR